MAWTTMKTWVAGDTLPAAELNTYLRDNGNELRTGGLALASQAANDIPYASSATQLARSANLAFNGTDLSIGALSKLRFDGGFAGDTYIVEGGSNLLQVFAGGSLSLEITATSVNLSATDKLYMDGGGNTYIVEGSADILQIFAGGSLSMEFQATSVNIQSTDRFYFDAGGDTYIVENSANVLRCVAGGTGGVDLTSGATAWVAVSDERLKVIIEPITHAVEKLDTIRPVIARYRTDDPDRRRSVLIAQDVQAVLPEAVSVDPEGYLGLRYTEVIPLLVAGIQELAGRVRNVEAVRRHDR